MFRFTIVCLLVIAATAGCANLKGTSYAGYCLGESNMGCPEHEGQGDCQPCPASAMTHGARHLSANTLDQRLP
jgi:hypothetical protein